jgi:hypothetical protein
MENQGPRCGMWLVALFFWGGLLALYVCHLLRIAVRHLWSHYVRPRQIWGSELPYTVEAVVEDFLAHRLSPEACAWLREEKTSPKWSPQAYTLQNELRERYGLGTWNQKLLRDCDTQTPEEAARYLLRRLWERVK